MTTIYPTNEAELIDLFRLAQDRLAWRIVDYTTRLYPDAIIENSHGQQLTVEFEHCAKNFQAHGHDPAGCDLIICWANNWPDAPLPVWALQECRAITDFLPFVTRMADFMGRRIAREIQAEVTSFGGLIARIDASLAQAYYKTEAHRRYLKSALADTLRPILEDREWLRATLSKVLQELAEMRGGVLFTVSNVGEEPYTFLVALHEGWHQQSCTRCGKVWRVSGASTEQSDFCSVECNLAAILEGFDITLGEL